MSVPGGPAREGVWVSKVLLTQHFLHPDGGITVRTPGCASRVASPWQCRSPRVGWRHRGNAGVRESKNRRKTAATNSH